MESAEISIWNAWSPRQSISYASQWDSYDKFLAKLASDQRKPNGQFAVTHDLALAWIGTLPVARFHGVGPVTAAQMKRLGIETGADLRARPSTLGDIPIYPLSVRWTGRLLAHGTCKGSTARGSR